MVEESPSPYLLIADDAIGGFFASNGGALCDDAGSLYYFAPDSLEWEPLDTGYTGFINWALAGDLQDYYAELRWTGWEAEVQALPADRTINFYPFLWAKADSLESRNRASVPVLESFNLQLGFAEQLGDRQA